MSQRNRTVVLLGNGAPQYRVPVHDPQTGKKVGERSVPHPYLRQAETRVEMQPGFDDPKFVELTLSTGNDWELAKIARSLPAKDRKYAVGIQHLERTWGGESGNPTPDWVDCEDGEFAKVIGKHFDIPVGQPTALITNAGRDYVHTQVFTTAYMALSANTTAESTASTTLPGEITTASGGLIRGVATFAHTSGTNTSTLTRTFTANSSDSLPVTIAKVGILTASSAGTLINEKLLSSTQTLTSVGDSLTVTFTETAG